MLDNEFKATRAKLVRDLADRPFHQGEVATPRHQIRERAIPNTGHQASSAGDNCFEHAMRIAQIAPWPKAFLPNSTAAQSASLRGWWMSWSNSTTMSPCSRMGTPTHVASVTPSGHVHAAPSACPSLRPCTGALICLDWLMSSCGFRTHPSSRSLTTSGFRCWAGDDRGHGLRNAGHCIPRRLGARSD
jgi:hypothetical protein